MQVNKLILDASGMASGSSIRSQSQRLAVLLNAYFPGERITASAVNKWVERGSVPSRWLMNIAKVGEAEGRPIDIAAYG